MSTASTQNTLLLIGTLLNLTQQAAQVTSLLKITKEEGREPTDAEIDALFDADKLARDRLQANIDAARAEQPAA